VLAEINEERIYCLGDVVGYGANPNEVIELLKSRRVKTMMGNHDYAVVAGQTEYFNSTAAIAIRWTIAHLTAKNLEYLRSLPREETVELGGARIYFTHGSPSDNLWEYVDPSTHSDLLGYYLRKLNVKMIGLGHTHTPFVWRGEGGIVANPGSVGQPRSGDNRASFALVEVKGDEIDAKIQGVGYDIDSATKKIVEAGLPKTLAERLYLGR
jgi:predicted phosphodiesterase